jgi:hypothetical protein
MMLYHISRRLKSHASSVKSEKFSVDPSAFGLRMTVDEV